MAKKDKQNKNNKPKRRSGKLSKASRADKFVGTSVAKKADKLTPKSKVASKSDKAKASKANKVVGSKSLDKKPNSKQEIYPHFRRYRKSSHPALIISEHSDDEYKYRKATSSDKPEGGRKPEKVEPNPDKTRATPMYIQRRVRHDKKNNFSKWPYPWEYKPKNDNKK